MTDEEKNNYLIIKEKVEDTVKECLVIIKKGAISCIKDENLDLHIKFMLATVSGLSSNALISLYEIDNDFLMQATILLYQSIRESVGHHIRKTSENSEVTETKH